LKTFDVILLKDK